MRKESATEPTAIPPISRSGKRNLRPKSPLIAAPTSGSRGTNQMYLYMFGIWRSVFGLGPWAFALKVKDQRPKAKGQKPFLPLQQINLVDPDRFLVPVEGNDNPQTDRRFRRRHYDDEDGEYLSGQGVRFIGR